MNTLFPPKEDLQIRWRSLQKLLLEAGGDACLLTNHVNIYYITGHIFMGYVYFPVDGDPVYFVQRSNNDLAEKQVVSIRKPEDIPDLLREMNLRLPEKLFFETDQITHNEYLRLESVFHPKSTGNASTLLRKTRMFKTRWEIDQFRISAAKHVEVYRSVPALFRKGMTDIEFQIEIERKMRELGSIGIFRTFGANMNIYMGSLLSGDNALQPSPFDFALGGRGLHPSLPIGASGEVIREGTSIMVDMAGNYTAYISDVSRVFSLGKLSEKAYQAHQIALDMQNHLLSEGKPGTACSDIYKECLKVAESAGLAANFMGISQQAKFVGHGVGLEINEWPVLMSRSKDCILPGMVLAFEPKFLLPGIGAVGIENTFLMTEKGLEKLTVVEEGIIEMD